MIYFYTGKPGNGKSLHMAEVIYNNMKLGKNVIANFEINEDVFNKVRKKEKLGKFIYAPNIDLLTNAYRNVSNNKYSYLDGLYNFALQFHKRNRKGQIIEAQTLLVLDECQELFNSRSWNRKDRLEWCSFFRQHRKLGYSVYLISQDDKVIDKQIRSILEYEVEHRRINNYKLFGKIVGLLCGGNLFVAITKWYSKRGKDGHIHSDFFIGRKKFYNFYDSYQMFHVE